VSEGPGWTLHLGDCLDPVTGLASLADKSVDHVITDPPYDEATHSRQRRGATGRDKSKGLGSATISLARSVGFEAISGADTAAVAAHVARLASRWALMFCAVEQFPSWRVAMEANGREHVRVGIWFKPGCTPQFTGDRPASACEAIEITHPPGRKRWNGGGRYGYWDAPIVKHQTGDRCHPTQKPLDLMLALVRDFTDPGEIVCDPFAGSGTTGVACIRLGRRFVGWERDPKYHAVAVKRLTQAREQLRMFEGAA
jgi:hypothetical protein